MAGQACDFSLRSFRGAGLTHNHPASAQAGCEKAYLESLFSCLHAFSPDMSVKKKNRLVFTSLLQHKSHHQQSE